MKQNKKAVLSKYLCCHYLTADVAFEVLLGGFLNRSLKCFNWIALAMSAWAFVVSQSSSQGKVPPTVGAGVWLFSGVNPDVPSKLPRCNKRFIALRAAVGLLSGVRPHVCGQRPLLCKGLAAVWAVVWRDAGVQALVPHKGARQSEAFVTERALEGSLPGVSPLMIPQLGRGVAALLAFRTRKLLPGEALHDLRVHCLQVGFQVPMAGKALQADGAVVGPLASMGPPMEPELALTCKAFFTESAREWLFPSVDSFVDHQKPLFWKSLLTHGAREGPFAWVRA